MKTYTKKKKKKNPNKSSDKYFKKKKKVFHPFFLFPQSLKEEKNFKKKKFKYENKAPAQKLDKTSNMYEKVQESMDSKYEQLIESYRKFTTDGAKTTPEDKVKRTIKDVAIKLQEIEQLVNYSSRLKTESGITRDGYGTSVNGSLTKIAERLTKIAERVRSLGE